MEKLGKGITESDASIAVRSNAVTALRIIKENDEYYVMLTITWSRKELFLTTARKHDEPRRFRHLGRLIEYLEVHYPMIKTLEIVLKS
jgi:hypothetical protein